MTPTWAFPLSLSIFIMIPTTVLIVGVILFFTKPKHANTVGAVLVVAGVIELSVWLGVTRVLASGESLIYLLTLLVGIGSIVYANKAAKN